MGDAEAIARLLADPGVPVPGHPRGHEALSARRVRAELDVEAAARERVEVGLADRAPPNGAGLGRVPRRVRRELEGQVARHVAHARVDPARRFHRAVASDGHGREHTVGAPVVAGGEPVF